MIKLVEYVRHQGWLYLFEEPVPFMFEKKVKEFFYPLKFAEYGLSLSSLVQGKKVKLDEETLGKILYIFIIGVINKKSTTNSRIHAKCLQGGKDFYWMCEKEILGE